MAKWKKAAGEPASVVGKHVSWSAHPELVRAARGLLGWGQEDLAARSGVSLSSIRNFENGRTGMVRANLTQIARALSDEGVYFIFNELGSDDLAVTTEARRYAMGVVLAFRAAEGTGPGSSGSPDFIIETPLRGLQRLSVHADTDDEA